MSIWERFRAHLLLIVLSLGVFIGLYHQAFFSPNSYLFNSSGDGIKNYYTYAYQTQHANDFLQFDGMNYPYSEHTLYTDNHFALSYVLHQLGVENNLIGTLNLLMLLGPIICCFFLFLILRRFQVPEFIAIIGAIAIALLAPQVFRLDGHYSLSYSFVIPMTWYFFLRFWDAKRRWVWTVILILNTTFWMFIHAYYGLLIGLFIGCYTLLYGLKNIKSIRAHLAAIFQLLAVAALPILFVASLLSSTDLRTDRNSNPYGFLAYHAEIETVFMPSHPPLKPLIDKVITIEEQIWEGWAYIGITSILVAGFTLLYLLYHRRKRNLERLKPIFDGQMGLFLLTGILLLIFAMGYPFRFKMLWLLDAIPGIGQFRSVGRFAWIFYFIITVFSVRMLTIYAHDLLLKRRKFWAFLLLFLGLGFYVVEALPHHFEMRENIVQSPNLFDADQLDAETQKMLASIDPDRYQVLLPLPYFHIGSEVFVQHGSDASVRLSQLISYHKKLPMLASALGRSSLSESKSLIELVDWRSGVKPVVELLDPNKPILVLFVGSQMENELKRIALRSNHEVLFSNSEYLLVELDPKEIAPFNDQAYFKKAVESETKLIVDSLGAEMVSAHNQSFLLRNFDDAATALKFHGNGALAMNTPEGYTELLSFVPENLEQGAEYVLSFWYHYQQDGFGPAIVASQKDDYMETKVQFQPFTTEVKYGNIFQGDWVLIELPIQIDSTEKPVHVSVCNIRNGHKTATIDNFMVRRSNDHLVQKSKGLLWWNNYPVSD